MDVKRICMYCMREKQSPDRKCEYCGFDNQSYRPPRGALSAGTVLSGTYLIGAVRKADGTSILYSGMDLQKEMRILVREFFNPKVMGRLKDGSSVAYFNEYKERFYSERETFRSGAEAYLQNHSGCRCFKENHTWYLVQYTVKKESASRPHSSPPASAPSADAPLFNAGVRTGQPLPSDSGRSSGRKRGSSRIIAVTGIAAVLLMIFSALLVRSGFHIGFFGGSASDPSAESGTVSVRETPTPEEERGGGDGAPEPSAGPTATPTAAPTPTAEPTAAPTPTATSTAAPTPTAAASATSVPGSSPSSTLEKEYSPGTTVMIYLCGSNLESLWGEASGDLEEAMEADIDTDVNNILVYTGGSKEWQMEGILSDVNGLYQLKDHSFEEVYRESKLLNMADPDTLAGFINRAVDLCPADHYQLVLWDHGGGPVWGYGYDENFDSKPLTAPEIRDAMDKTVFAEKPLDLIAYNACIMGSVETALLWSDYADYMLADAETEFSWDFSYLEILNETSDPVRTAYRIGELYEEALDDPVENPTFPVSLCCMNLHDADHIASALTSLGEDLNNALGNGGFSDISCARTPCLLYGYFNTGDKEYAGDLADLGELCTRLAKVCPDSAEKLKTSCEESIVFRTGRLENMMGLSVYWPCYDKDSYSMLTDYSEEMKVVFPWDSWRNFLSEFGSRRLNGSSDAEWSLKVSSDDGNPRVVLTDSQLAETAAVRACILEDFGNGTYGTVMQNYPMELREDGTAKLEELPPVICLVTDENDTAVPVPSLYLQGAGNVEYYRTESIQPDGFISSLLSTDPSAPLFASYTRESENGELRMLMYDSQPEDTSGIAGTRNEVSLAGVDAISYEVPRIRQTKASDGGYLPCSEWKKDAVGERKTLRIDPMDLPVPREMSVRNSGRKYVCQIVVEDAYGGLHGSSLIEIKS